MKSYMYILFLLLLCVGCQTTPQGEQTDDRLVRLSTSIEESSSQSMPVLVSNDHGNIWRISSAPRETRHVGSYVSSKVNAAGSGFTNGDKIGLYLVEWEGNDPNNPATQTKGALSGNNNHTDNHLFTANAAVDWVGNPALLGHPLTWRKMNGYGYFPHRASVDDATRMAVSVRENQSGGLSQSDDFMWGKSADGIEPRNSAIGLTFKHCLTQIIASITLPSTYNSKQIASITSVVVLNTSPTGVVNLSEGVVRSSTSLREIKLACTKGAGALVGTYEALILPTNLVYGQALVRVDFKCTDASSDFLHYTVPSAGISLLAGQKYTLTLHNEELSFGSELSFVKAGGDLDLAVWSNVTTSWTIKSNDSWLTVGVKGGAIGASVAAQIGNKTLTVRAASNAGVAPPRVGTLTMTGTVDGKVVTRTAVCHQL